MPCCRVESIHGRHAHRGSGLPGSFLLLPYLKQSVLVFVQISVMLNVHAGELIGTGVAGLGGAMLAAGSGQNKGVTLIGDLACLVASCCFPT